MIAKHVPMKSLQKSNFSELVEYITDEQEKHERVGAVTTTNCHSEQADIAALEVLNTQLLNTRSEADKTYHLIVSFRVGELPDEETLKAIEERICAGIGFAGHQRVSAVHHDTDNVHIHIAINKIHPTRYTIHEPFNAYHTLGQLCDKLEDEYGLQKDNHKAGKTGSENRASDMERHADVESLLGWIKRECQDQIRGAQSWSALHQVMRDHGLEIREHGNGLVISAENGITVKASSVSREFSKQKLEGRLGGFTKSALSGAANPKKRYDKQPMRSKVNTVELHARYKHEQQNSMANRADEWAKAVARKNRLIEDAKRSGRLKRATIKISGAPAMGKRLMYAAASATLRADIAAINKQYKQDRQEIYEKYQRRTWADWLRSEALKGDKEALEALRGREATTGLAGNTMAGKGAQKPFEAPFQRDGITKRGTIIYKVGDSAVRDDGDKLKVSRGADDAAMLAALRMAQERYGDRITVNGTAEFKERIARAAATANLAITFDDAALEARRQQLVQPLTTKEKPHVSNDRQNRGRTDRIRTGGPGHAATRAAAARAAAAGRAAGATGAAGPAGATGAERIGQHGRHAIGAKSHARSAGKNPPPQAKNAVRDLSQRSVVHVSERGEVLLPGHVPGHLEQQGAKPDHGVRRDIHRPGITRRSTPVQPTAPHGQAMPGAGKTKIGKVGMSPPPGSKDRLRRLSQLGSLAQLGSMSIGEPAPAPANPTPPAAGQAAPTVVAAVAAPAPWTAPAVTMPTATPAQPPREKPKSAKKEAGTRRDIFGLDPKPAGEAAAEKYIAEREQKRAKMFDIPKHVKYNFTNDATVVFGGVRQVDGQNLALLKQGDEVAVLPVDEATVRRLKRVSVGDQVSVTAKGAIKTKGRSR
jgi:molybdopterin converting factor small subunit